LGTLGSAKLSSGGARICVLYKAYSGERTWKDIGHRLQAPYYRSRVDHCWKIRPRKIGTVVGKFSFANGTIADWHRLPEGALGLPSFKRMYSERGLRKYISEVK
jgi:hypothetical protein